MNPKDRIGATKVPLGLIPPAALAHTAVAMYDGASKYGRWNWRGESVAASVYVDACLRHILDWYHGEEIADDSQAHHLGHAIACLAIILDAQGTENLIDDRPAVNQNCSEIFAQLSEKIKRINGLREQAQHVTKDVQKAALQELSDQTQEMERTKGCCAPSIYSNTQEERVVDYYGIGEAQAIQDQKDDRIVRTECILGHQVDFFEGDDQGYIDGELVQGTAFRSKVGLYRSGYQYIDDKLAAEYREANGCEQPAT